MISKITEIKNLPKLKEDTNFCSALFSFNVAKDATQIYRSFLKNEEQFIELYKRYFTFQDNIKDIKEFYDLRKYMSNFFNENEVFSFDSSVYKYDNGFINKNNKTYDYFDKRLLEQTETKQFIHDIYPAKGIIVSHNTYFFTILRINNDKNLLLDPNKDYAKLYTDDEIEKIIFVDNANVRLYTRFVFGF